MTDLDILSSYLGLVSLATLTVYTGAFSSLPFPRKDDTTPSADRGGDDQYQEEESLERLSVSEASLFPIVGSVTLFGLYLVVKYLGTDWINWFLRWYCSFAGLISTPWSFVRLARSALGASRWMQFDITVLYIQKGPTHIGMFTMRTPSLFLVPLGTLPALLYTFWPPGQESILISDILSVSFAHAALSNLKLDTFQTGCVLLFGLFMYDVWWVFGTEVMLTVATSLDIPIKLLWPKSMTFSNARGYTILGLGDIVIPGMFIALSLRYDYHRFRTSPSPHRTFDKPYFHAALVGYTAALAACMAVMHAFDAAQPALLYISPACILSFLITAATQGELRKSWQWTDGLGLSKNELDKKDVTAAPTGDGDRPE